MDRRLYIITYDLKHKLLRNYNPFYNQLKSFGEWAHYMDNTWFVISDLTPEQMYNRLAPRIFTDCHILIVRFSRENFGLLPSEAWEWLNNHSTYF